jgi:hypothetical protein
MASKHTANNETQVKSRILSNAEKEIISSTTDAWSSVMFTCNKQTNRQAKYECQANTHRGCPSCILTVITMIIIICNVTQYNLIDMYQCFASSISGGHVIQHLMERKDICHCGMPQGSDPCVFRSTCPSHQNEATLIAANVTFLFRYYNSPSNLTVPCFWSHESIGTSQFVITPLVSYHL